MDITNPNETMTHKRLLLNHLLAGKTINGLQALTLYKCMSLSQRLSDLRLDYGVPIKGKMIKVASGKRVKEYWLEPSYIQYIKQNNINPLERKA